MSVTITPNLAGIYLRESKTFTASGAVSYIWKAGTVQVGTSASITVSPTQSTEYTCYGYDANGVLIGSARVYLSVFILPTVIVSVDKPTINSGDVATITVTAVNQTNVQYALAKVAITPTTGVIGATEYDNPTGFSGFTFKVGPAATTVYTISATTKPPIANMTAEPGTATALITVNGSSVVPVISNLSARAGSSNTQGIVSWLLNVPSTCYVKYGLTTAYGNTTQPQPGLTKPSILILGLQCNTLYHAQAVSLDSNGAPVTSADITFTTRACGGDVTKPIITDLTFLTTEVPGFVPVTSNSLTCPFSITATDNVGVTGYYFSESPTTPSLNAFSSILPSSFTFSRAKIYSTEGFNILYAWVRDAAGNISDPYAQSVWIDLSCNATPIKISNVAARKGSSQSIIVTWNTNIIGINHVDYGTDPVNPQFSTSPTDPYGTPVNILCTGVQLGTTVYYQAVSEDPCGNVYIVKGNIAI